MMFPQLPDKRYNKKLHLDSSPIAPTDEQCDRMLQNVLSATAQTDCDVSYTEVVDELKGLEAKQHHRQQAVLAGSFMAVFAIAIGLTALFRGDIFPGGHTQIADETIPLAGIYEQPSTLPRYMTAIHTVDGKPADEDLAPALRGMRNEDGQLYFYFENEAASEDWQAISATSTQQEEVAPQTVDAVPHMLRFPFPEGGLDILVENAQGQRVVVVIRTM